jgi:DNA-binding response OmpR family regulator
MANETILVVEDDPVARRFLADNLLADGYEILEAGTLAGAERVLARDVADLAVVDLGLPDGDGLELLRAVRDSRGPAAVDPHLPILVLSGRAGEVERLRGFARGADDYVAKPYSVMELTARIDALLRRRRRPAHRVHLRVGELDIDLAGHRVRLHGVPVHLSGKEFSLLRVLAADPTRVFTRAELLEEVWGYREIVPTRTLDSHAWRLRNKLNTRGDRFIVNVWGVGYRLSEGACA